METYERTVTEGTLNLTATDILKNRDAHPARVVAQAIEVAEAKLRGMFVQRCNSGTSEATPSEDALEDLIDSSFEYLCAQVGVKQAEELCRSFEQ